MSDVARRSMFDLYDRLLDGGLTKLLREWREQGVTLDEQSFRLRDHGVTASRDTVRRWQVALAESDQAAS